MPADWMNRPSRAWMTPAGCPAQGLDPKTPRRTIAMPKSNNSFVAEVGRTHAGSFRIVVRARNPKAPASSYRQLSVCVYNLAAEMERRSDKLGARWVVSPEVFNAKIVLELTDGDDEQAAGRFV